MRVQVKDTKLVKDINTGAIINTDSQDKKNRLRFKAKQQAKEQRINILEEKIATLTELIVGLTILNDKVEDIYK